MLLHLHLSCEYFSVLNVQRLASEAERLQREHLWQDGIKVKHKNYIYS